MNNYNNTSRRDFLKLASAIGVNTALAPLSLNLAAMSKAAAADANDYKALVCVFLHGGNDHYNTIIPVDNANYAEYKKVRRAIALDQSSLLDTKFTPLNSLPSNTMELALNPYMTGLKELFDRQKLAMLFNVGTLSEPTSLKQYINKSVPLPPNLFSHNDQQSIWQSFEPEGAREGWGGKILEFVHDTPDSQFSSISTSGSHVFLSGNKTLPYQMLDGGGIAIKGARPNDSLYESKKCAENFKKLITENTNNIVADEYTKIVNRSLEAESVIRSGFKGLDENIIKAIEDHFPYKSKISQQLKSVAKMIAIRDRLGMPIKRQVFMVSMGGFDHHDNLLGNHGLLLKLVSESMTAFYKSMETLNIQDSVTTFTGSDFGRTFSSNGDGSDHGWGSHHFIMGGAVNGGRTYGDIPEVALKTSVDTGRGRLLPTTSVNSYMATLAQWFGVKEGDLEYISPYINNFDNKDIGFMKMPS